MGTLGGLDGAVELFTRIRRGEFETWVDRPNKISADTLRMVRDGAYNEVKRVSRDYDAFKEEHRPHYISRTTWDKVWRDATDEIIYDCMDRIIICDMMRNERQYRSTMLHGKRRSVGSTIKRIADRVTCALYEGYGTLREA